MPRPQRVSSSGLGLFVVACCQIARQYTYCILFCMFKQFKRLLLFSAFFSAWAFRWHGGDTMCLFMFFFVVVVVAAAAKEDESCNYAFVRRTP